jgi:chorismate mutase
MPVFALRGAIAVERNDRQEILAATDELMREIMARNDLAPEQLVSCLFTATADLDAEFPALAVRWLGAPLLCAQEIPVAGAMPRVIRVMVHYNAEDGHSPTHVYLREAQALRTDLESPQ